MATQIQVNGKVAYITATGFKIGSKGKVMPAGEFLSLLPTKGQRRQIRKMARANGYNGHASAVAA